MMRGSLDDYLTGYLQRQWREFGEARRELCTNPDIFSCDIDNVLFNFLRQIYIYYPLYLSGELSREKFVRLVQKELRVFMATRMPQFALQFRPFLRDVYVDFEKQDEEIQLNILFRFVESLYMNFESPGELKMLIDAADKISTERSFTYQIWA